MAPKWRRIGEHTRESLDEGNIPRRPLLVEKTSTYGNKPVGTEWHIVTAGNWLDHSEMLRSMEYEQGTGREWFFPHLLFFFFQLCLSHLT